jgi:hypothetical protein
VWGSPKAKGVFTLGQTRNILEEAKKLGTVTDIAIEGGESFLYYPVMLNVVRDAVGLGFRVEILSNCYWAASSEDAVEWLRPIAEAENVRLSLSSDLYHGESWKTAESENAVKAANTLGIRVGVVAVKNLSTETPCPNDIEGAKVDLWELMYRGRAASKLTEKAVKKPWREFTKCPYEDFVNQKRVHVDAFGFMHVCQGISIGNAWQKPLSQVIAEYNPYENPILEPLVRGGPVALVERFSLTHEEAYADACHLCYAARCMLRDKYPEILAPNQMYGELAET